MLIGIVGKPSVGKSTFFKAVTLAEVEIAAYPFTTIKPNSGVAYVKVDCVDSEFNTQCNPRQGFCVQHKRFVPVELMDVAGLVPGAHEGKGMGNAFLDDLRQAHVLIHVIDVAGSTNEKGEMVAAGSYDPVKDIEFLEFELDMWYFRLVEKGWEKFARIVQQEKGQIAKHIGKQLSGLGVTDVIAEDVIQKQNFPEDIMKWNGVILKRFAIELRKITKPMIIACNKVDDPAGRLNFERLKKEFPHHYLIACSAEAELALREAARHELISYVPGEKDFEILKPEKLSEKQKQALSFIKTNVLDVYGSTGVQQVMDEAVFKLLGYSAIFPGGVNKLEDSEGRRLPDCFLMPPRSTALDFAYRLHTDLGKHFIRAINVKTKRVVGKEYQLKHRDVIEIVTGK